MLNTSDVAPIVLSSVEGPQPSTVKPRLFLADDHLLIMETLSLVLAPDFDIVGVSTQGDALVDEIVRLQPDVVVLDITMPSVSGLDVARLLVERSPRTKIVFLTMHASRVTIKEAFRSGAAAYVVKSCASKELVLALKTVLRGGTYLSTDLQEVLAKPDSEELSERQVAVLRLIAQGFSAKQIAFKLNISSRTAEFHKNSIMGKLQLRTTAQLTRWAMEQGLTS